MDDGLIEDRAPAVVAVLVTRDPGPWFDEVLAALAAQDYEEFSVLVLVSGGEEDPTARVARVLPDAFVRRLDADRGFGAASNEALGMVEGAAYLLLCHDDCVPDPDAVHILVEEAFRSNAGIVSPKMVRWDDPSVLLHVGMNVDKTGAVVERVQPGEVDHGQHDAVRDVFSVAGGFTLVRADLMAELGGFDDGIVALGEDLDLCWRAQVAGARVLVVPDARVRHLEAVAGGVRAPALPPGEAVAPTLQALQRRHELRAVLKCYSPFHLVRVLPQALLLAFGEVVVSLLVRDRVRARAVAGAWRWNLGRLGPVRRLRRQVKAHRLLPDSEVRQLQLRGSARLSTYFSRLVHEDVDVAHGKVPDAEAVLAADQAETDEPVLTGSVGLAFSEDDDFDELDDLGHRSGRDRFGRRRRRPALSSRRSRLVAWLAVALVLAFGTRDLFGGGLPLVGQFLPLPSWTGTWHQFLSAWQTPGLGTTAPSTPAFGILGVLGTATLGGMGLLQKLLVLGCIPVGAWGVSRLLRPLCSPRARLIGAAAYLGLPLAYNALAQGRWDGLVAYAAVPWLLAGLARASGVAPFGPRGAEPGEAAAPGAGASSGRRWRDSLPGQAVVIGVIEAVAVAFAPSVAVVLVVCAVGVAVGSLLVGQWRGTLRVLLAAAGATVTAAVLCAPWVVGTLAAGRGAVAVFGLTGAPSTAPTWSDLLRFAVGPTGGTALGWLLVASALLPLLIGRGPRLAWAARWWVVACCSWGLALVVARGWSSPFSPSVDVLLAPAAVAVAAGVGLGVSAFENDLAGYHFGWRQVVSTAGLVAAVVGLVPVVAASGDGRWGLVTVGYGQPLSVLASPTAGAPAGAAPVGGDGGYRVLWLGDPRALPTGGWSITPGLAYATSESGTPVAVNLWSPAGPGPATTLGRAVELAEHGGTVHLGQLLAPAAVRYVVVVQALAPDIEGVQQPAAFPAPADLVPALARQDDLSPVPSPASGFSVFENTAGPPERAERATPVPAATPALPPGYAGYHAVFGWQPVLPGPPGAHSYAGPLTAGTVLAGYAPAGRWHLLVGGRPAPSSPAFGWAAQYRAGAGAATLAFSAPPLLVAGLWVWPVLWLVALLALVGGRRWIRRPRRRARPTAAGEGS